MSSSSSLFARFAAFFVLGCATLVAGYNPGVNTTRICGPLDTISSGDYTLINNIWSYKGGSAPQAPGYQCSQITARDDSNIKWNLNYNWSSSGGFVKGFANVQQNKNVGHRLVNILSMPTTWRYNVTAVPFHELTYNVAYDMYTAASATLTAPHTAEIMIWTSVQYMQPVSYKNATGFNVPNITNLALGGGIWNFYTGFSTRTNAPVYSFVSTAGKVLPINFQTDAFLFIRFLMTAGLLNPQHYLNVVSAGSEVIKALNATIATTYFNIDINIAPNVPLSSSMPVSSPKPTSTSTSTSSPTPTPTSTPRPTSTSSSVAPPTSSVAQPKQWRLIGPCVSDPFPNNLLSWHSTQFALTPAVCWKLCDQQGYTYAGLEFGSNCYCDNKLNTANGRGKALPTSSCSQLCNGDYKSSCGGFGTMVLYQKS